MSQNKDPHTQQQDDAVKAQEMDLEQMLADAQAKADEAEKSASQTISRDEELEQAKEQAMRAMAELQNAKRRMEEDRQAFVKYAAANVLTALLPVIDNFDRALSAIPADISGNDWVKGMDQISKAFFTTLEKEGLEKIAPKKGDNFNANFHEALMQDPSVKEGKVANVLETGYSLKGKVLRVAKVSVGNA